MTAAAQIETTFHEEHGRVLAALISQLGDFALAEDAQLKTALGEGVAQTIEVFKWALAEGRLAAPAT
jgi:predicted RNA polymerase sigma factor